MDEKEPFLSRWSRRKLEAKEDPPAAVPAAELPTATPAAPSLPATQPTPAGATAGASPEYREFFDPRVDEKLRRTALKKMFSDPHFNVMDGLDTYIDDYSIADPIPAAMLRQLNQAKELFLFDDEKKTAEGAGGSAAAGDAATAAPVASADTSALQQPSEEAAADEDAGVAARVSAVPPVRGGENA